MYSVTVLVFKSTISVLKDEVYLTKLLGNVL